MMTVHSKNITARHADFIRMTEVRTILEELTLPMLNQMKQREEEAMSMKNRIMIISDEIKIARQETR